jgi:beta-glucosidase
MKKFLKILLFLILGLLGIIVILLIGFNIYYGIINTSAKSDLIEKQTLAVGGFEFRDLNNNGQLDVYEDSRQDVENRVEDLLSQMTVEEKVGLMWHPPLGVGDEGELLSKPNPKAFSLVSTYDVVLNKKIRHFNLFRIPSTENLARWYNKLQKLAEQDRLGIPITISSDPRHGVNNFVGNDMLGGDFSKWPEPIGLAATNDSSLVVEFGKIANKELSAVGIRTALHPMADLATEPRWARINGTFGEDADLSAKITAAYIYGFQGRKFGPQSVACMTKHWPGGGPQKDGWDAHFRYGMDQDYPGNNFRHHLKPFEAAFEAGTAMIMPYYGIPLGQTSEDVGMSFNKEIITDLLRNEYGYEGIICTDWGIIKGMGVMGIEIFEGATWGVDDLSVKERIQKAIEAGIDQFGGSSNTRELVELVYENKINETRIDDSARRLLRAKFQMGLFDNPYIDVENAVITVGKSEFVEKGKIAQRKSIVMLKNHMNDDSSYVMPLNENIKIYVENIEKSIAGKYATVVDSLDEADFAILRIQTPWVPRDGANFFENFFHQGDMDFKEPELSRILDIAKRKPTIISIYLDRPAIIPEIADISVGLFGEFGAYDDSILDIIFGKHNPTAILPFELPSSMEAVKNQYEDVPYDTKDPLYPFGYGLRYE